MVSGFRHTGRTNAPNTRRDEICSGVKDMPADDSLRVVLVDCGVRRKSGDIAIQDRRELIEVAAGPNASDTQARDRTDFFSPRKAVAFRKP
jgi:hypothetical protein